MNKAVELLNLWADFEKQKPDADIADFCRAYLGTLAPAAAADDTEPALHSLHYQARAAAVQAVLLLKGTGINSLDEYLLLQSIHARPGSVKSHIISHNQLSKSGGTEMLERLTLRGYIIEHADVRDKRIRRLHLTKLGARLLSHAHKVLAPLYAAEASLTNL